MEEYKLSDIAEVRTGPFGSQLHNEDYVSTGTPIVTILRLFFENLLTAPRSQVFNPLKI